jgi:hypothetical protein
MTNFFSNAVNAGKVGAKKATTKAEIVLLDRRIPARKKRFGIDLYENLYEMTCQQDFYATSDETIAIIRPLLLATDREIRAIDTKKLRAKGELDLAKSRRASAFPEPAKDWKEKAKNAGKATSMAGNEAKIKTEMALLTNQVKLLKEKFGMDVYPVLETFFDGKTGQIPVHSETDKSSNTIRAIFQQTHADIDVVNMMKQKKRDEMDAMSVDMSLRRL